MSNSFGFGGTNASLIFKNLIEFSPKSLLILFGNTPLKIIDAGSYSIEQRCLLFGIFQALWKLFQEYLIDVDE